MRERDAVLRRCLGLLLLVAASAGCSVQLAYNNLDRLARWSVDDYLNMDAAQRAYFDAAVAEVWDWHRRQELPRYAGVLEATATSFAEGTSEAEMQRLVDRVVGWADAIEARALPVAAELLASLNDEQVAGLGRALEQRNDEVAEPERGVDAVDAQRLWLAEFTDRFTEFSGELTTFQQTYLERAAARYRPERVMWADYRRRWQADLLTLLSQRQDVEGFTRGFEQLARNRALYYGGELAAVVAHNEALTRELSVWLINAMTERQRARFSERLTDLAEDFRELAAASPPPPHRPPPLPCLARC